MLDQKLEEYTDGGVYPFHMPGHKRCSLGMGDPYAVDITEIEGFDDLHHPTGEIKDLQEEWAKLYGADEAFLSVNGSTAGILSGIFAACETKEEVLIARNAHASVYRGALLRDLKPVYLYPESLPKDPSIFGEISPESFDRILKEHPRIRAAVITSPTYEGICSDIKTIATIAHEHRVALIVDAAHGAHFGMADFLPLNPISLGADLVILSLHKTLPALTSVAIVLKNDNSLIQTDKIGFYLDCFETSSPSYVLMASAAKCLDFLKKNSDKFSAYKKNLDDFYRETNELKYLSLLCAEHKDIGKLVICGNGYLTGEEIARKLREDTKIETEMASADYCLAMSSLMDTKEAFCRLRDGLFAIDETIKEKSRRSVQAAPAYPRPQEILSMSEAVRQKKCLRRYYAAVGCVSADFVSLYPPGIPILCPGELVTEEIADFLSDAEERHLRINGSEKKGIFIVE